jgi:uncharacterized protein (TIGR00297 family)
MVGFLIVGSGLRGMVLFYFYQIGSMATKFQKSIKETRDSTCIGHSARGAKQVLAVSVTAVTLSLLHVMYCGKEQAIVFHTVSSTDNSDNSSLASSLTCAVLAHHATSLADTLASELGLLAKHQPRLITQPWRSVPAGTNGGITVSGTFWSIVGGAIIGALYVAMDWLSGIAPLNTTRMILYGACTGLIGSLLDSLLGALVQSSYYDRDTKLIYHANSDNLPKSAECISGINILTNEQVNFVSAFMTAMLGGWVIGPLLFAVE